MSTVFYPLVAPKSPAPRRGFSLMELLVVVGIITLLIAILVPALGGAKKQAYATNTKSLMSQLSSNCEAYHNIFSAYPGPASYQVTTASSNKISGAQNLLLGLSFSMSINPLSGPGAIQPLSIPGTPQMYVDAGKPLGVANFSTISPSGQPEQLPPFFSPKTNQMPPAPYAAGGVTGISGATNVFNFPVIVDAFPDALPILYYRRMPAGITPSYNLTENIEYTSATALRAANGSISNQTANTAMTSQLLNAIATGGNQAAAGPGPTNGTSNPGFVLISAGTNRMYGYAAGATAKADGFVVTGGY